MKGDPRAPAPGFGKLLWEGWGEGGKPNCEPKSPVGREGLQECVSWRLRELAASSQPQRMSKCNLLGL